MLVGLVTVFIAGFGAGRLVAVYWPAANTPAIREPAVSEHEHAEDSDHGYEHAQGAGGHAGHSHGVAADADRRWLITALALIAGFMLVEVTVGFLAHSLALISDAAHMLTDAASIILALAAMRLAARPARGGYTYGLKRAEILSAQANGVTLLVLSA